MTTANKTSGGQYAGKAASERERERKQKLIAAGIQLIGQKGYAATTIEAVCAEAKLTKRYFYQLFENREDLMLQAHREANKEFMNSILMAAAPHLQDSQRLVHAGLTQTFSFVRDNPEKGRLILIEANSIRGKLGHVYDKSYKDFVALLVQFTKPFLKDNDPGEVILTVMAKGAIGAIVHLCLGWIATDFEQPIEELVLGTERIFAGMGRELGIPGWLMPGGEKRQA